MAKVAVKMEIKIKRCPETFKPELGVGVIASQVVEWDIPEKYLTGNSHMLHQAVMESEREFVDENIEVVITEVE